MVGGMPFGRTWGGLTRPWVEPAILISMGFMVRIVWLMTASRHSYAQGEISNVAIAFARSGMLADAFRPGQGPTAHVLPMPPIYAGLIYRVFGVRSDLSEGILTFFAISVALGSQFFLYITFKKINKSNSVNLLGLAFACLVPLNFSLEVVDFRIWEGSLAVLFAFGYLYYIVQAEGLAKISNARAAAMSMAAAAVLFINPALGVAAYICSGIFIWDNIPLRRWPIFVVMATVSLAIIIAPWAIRNKMEMGDAVLLRSNFGLELALGNHAGAVIARDDRQVFRDRLQQLHPFQSQQAFDAMKKSGGEIAYARGLGQEAKSWIVANPGAFVYLCTKHLTQYFFPPAWQWNIYSDRSSAVGIKVALQWLLSAIGIIGAIVALICETRRYRYAVIMLFVPAIPYMIVQPVLRYRYIMYGLTIFFSVDLLGRILNWLRRTPSHDPTLVTKH